MAKSGSFSKTFSSGYTLKVAWSESNVDTTNNQSDITCKVTLSADSSYYISSSASKDISLTINGTKYTSTCTVGLDKGETKTLMTKTVSDITHSSDGSKSVSISCTLDIDVTLGGSKVSSVTASGTATLTTIARASSITSVSNTTLGESCNIKWTPASKSFYYKVKLKLGDWSWTSDAINPNQTSEYTYSTPSLSMNVAKQLPSATSGTMTAYLYTYSNSDCSTKVGSTSSKTFTVKVPSSVVPTVDSSSITIDNSANSTIKEWGLYVAGYSKAKITASASGSYNSTISSFTISGSYSATKSGTSLSYTGDKFTSSGEKTFYVVAKDSRGRNSEKNTVGTITVYAYTKPAMSSFKVARDSSDATKINVYANWSYAPVTGKNTTTATLYYKKSTDSSWTTYGTIPKNTNKTLDETFDDINSYNFKVTVQDTLSNTATATASVSTTAVLLDFRAGGKGLGIGKIAESDNMEVGMKSIFSKYMYFDNNIMIFGTNTDGTKKEALNLSTGNNNTTLGYGNYDLGSGTTSIYGNNVMIYSAAAGNVGYYPYYKAGDTIENTIYTAGFISSSGSTVYFTVPLTKPIIGSPTITVSSSEGFRIRQNNSYLYGGDSSTNVKPSSYATALTAYGIRIYAEFSNTTNVTNNSSCGIWWSGVIKLS